MKLIIWGHKHAKVDNFCVTRSFSVLFPFTDWQCLAVVWITCCDIYAVSLTDRLDSVCACYLLCGNVHSLVMFIAVLPLRYLDFVDVGNLIPRAEMWKLTNYWTNGYSNWTHTTSNFLLVQNSYRKKRKTSMYTAALGVGLLMVMIWLELCMSYSSSCHRSQPPSSLALVHNCFVDVQHTVSIKVSLVVEF